jgi:hypothetical protein
MKSLALALVVAIGACADSATSVVLDVRYDGELPLEQLGVKVDGVVNTIEAREEVTLLLSNKAAGKLLAIEVDGLRRGIALAHGQVEVTPVAGAEVRVVVDMVPTGVVCQPDVADQCLNVPEPMCISDTTLRSATGPGSCLDNICNFEFVDTECPKGCVDDHCVCDIVTKTTAATIDVDTVIVDRTFKVNGQAVPDSSVNGFGQLFLRNALTGDEVTWGSTTQASSPVAVVAGTYDVFYEVSSFGSGSGGAITVPRNKRAKIMAGVDLSTAQTLAIDVTAVRADRSFNVNGAPVPDSSANGFGNLFLRNVATGDEVSWGATSTASSPVQIVAGTYDVFYEVSSTGTGTGGVVTVPRNKRARIVAGASIMAAGTVDLSVTEIKVDRTFRVNGQPVPDFSANGFGRLFLRNTATGDEVSWSDTDVSSSQVPVVAGTYDVFYEFSTAGSGAGGVVTVPRNKRAKIASGLNLAATGLTPLDITTVKADRVFKINGAVLTDSSVNGFGNLFLRNVATGDEVSWSTSLVATSPVGVIVGNYDVFYELVQTGSGVGGATVVPKNKRARVATNVNINSTTPLELAVTAVKVDRSFKVNGEVLTDFTVNGSGNLFIRNAATGDEVSWSSSTTTSSPQQIIAGTYDVFYEASSFGSGVGGAPLMPRNKKARVATAVALDSTTPLDLATSVVKVDRTFAVNSQTVPDSFVNGIGNLFVRNSLIADETAWSSTTQTSSKIPVLVGTYDLFYELSQAGSGSGGAIVVPRNKRALINCIEVKP